MKYIISGANGFIGQALIRFITKNNPDDIVFALIYKSEKLPSSFEQNKQIVPIRCDLERNDNDFSYIPDEVDVFFNFAWIGVSPEQRNIFEFQYRNINITMNCLYLAKEKKVKKYIAIGSTNEYLYSRGLINKDSIPTPNDSYGAVKVAIRYLQKQFLHNEKIPFVYAIITGIYSENRRDNNIITYTIKKLLDGEKPSLTKCEQLWDYVHIDDVVAALLKLAEMGKTEKIYAIGHGDNWALSNYVNIIRDKINPDLALGFGDIPYSPEIIPA